MADIYFKNILISMKNILGVFSVSDYKSE